ncbi:MAG: SAM-dependent methyltransferase, partial [Myxococcota bacterium]
ASTGGFTDVLLTRGARRVYAIDVGYGLLDARLRADPRVVPCERTNVRTMAPASIPEPVALATIDVSFISLRLVLPMVRRLLDPGGAALALVKPQFEVGRGGAKHGVVRDERLRRGAIDGIAAFARQSGFEVLGERDSSLRGPKGNLETFLHLRSCAFS